MLERLIIEDILLIDRLELSFSEALTVLTGETGAGKSILLDALGLALGERASPSLVRPGAKKAQVSAVFTLSEKHPVQGLLLAQDVPLEEGVLILRRTVSEDGKSRAFVNDRPVTASFLKELSLSLIEIHGQFDQLLQSASHRRLLDVYASLSSDVAAVSTAYFDLEKAQIALAIEKKALQEAQENHDFLCHAVKELEEISPEVGEEDTLLKERTYLTHRAKICEALQEAYTLICGEAGAETFLGKGVTLVEKANLQGDGRFQELFETLRRCLADLEEGRTLLDEALHADTEGADSLETLEDRLFSLKALARKHGVVVDALPALLESFQKDLHKTKQGDAALQELELGIQKIRKTYIKASTILTAKRQKAAKMLAAKVTAELPPLKLEKASFFVMISPLSEEHWGPNGLEVVEFQVQTNKGLAPGSLAKIASGGERARFMLALKVVLSQQGLASLVVFDEIDAGVGGAVASAIGERLARLGDHVQVLAITHSPQVASYASCHYVVSKSESKGLTTTRVEQLSKAERREEIARMLSGEDITPEARAAAEALLIKAS